MDGTGRIKDVLTINPAPDPAVLIVWLYFVDFVIIDLVGRAINDRPYLKAGSQFFYSVYVVGLAAFIALWITERKIQSNTG